MAHLTVVLEQNQAQFKAFGEALTALGLVKVAVLENARDTKNKVNRDEVLAIVHGTGS